MPLLVHACVALPQFKICARTVAPCIPLAPQQPPLCAVKHAASLRLSVVCRCVPLLPRPRCVAPLSLTCSAARWCVARCLERMASSADASRCPRWKRLFRIGLAFSTMGSLRHKVALLRLARAAAQLEEGQRPVLRGSVALPVSKRAARLDRESAEVIRLLDMRIASLHRKLDRRLTRGEAAQARSMERERLHASALPPSSSQAAAVLLLGA